MANLLDNCRFTAGSSGTADFADGAAVVGCRNLSGAGATNGVVYRYKAQNATGSQWERGFGAYNSGTGVIARSTVVDSSDGGSKINFTTNPEVILSPGPPDLVTPDGTQTLTNKTLSSGALVNCTGYGSGRASFRASKSGNQTLADNVFTAVTWDTENSDIGGFFSSSVWTPPAGIVLLQAFGLVGGTFTAGSSAVNIRILKNGSPLVQYSFVAQTSGQGFAFITAIDEANGADGYTVDLQANVNSGSPTLNSGANSGFAGTYLGPTS